ncbi:hypothetical protein [Natribaculum luteum]
MGVEETLEAAEAKLRAWTDREKTPEPSRVETLREDAAELEQRDSSGDRESTRETRGVSNRPVARRSVFERKS